jgi:large subunit ribosomal protein L24
MDIKKGDTVVILTGKDAKKKGKVTKVNNNKVNNKYSLIVEGLNIAKKAMRPTQKMPQGGIIEKELPFFRSKVMIICPVCNQQTRGGYRILTNGKKARCCKKCGELIDKE